jgi:carboxylesterase type B
MDMRNAPIRGLFLPVPISNRKEAKNSTSSMRGPCTGLFHRAIAQSGSALNPWGYEDPQTARRKAFRFAETLGCTTTDSYEMLEFLMRVPAQRLVETMELSITEEVRTEWRA